MSAGDLMYEMSEQMIIIMMNLQLSQAATWQAGVKLATLCFTKKLNSVHDGNVNQRLWECYHRVYKQLCLCDGMWNTISKCSVMYFITGIYFLRIAQHVWVSFKEKEKGGVSVTQGLMGALSSFILIAVVADLSVTLATVAVR